MKLAATKQLCSSSPLAMHGHFASDGGELAVTIIGADQVEGSEAATGCTFACWVCRSLDRDACCSRQLAVELGRKGMDVALPCPFRFELDYAWMAQRPKLQTVR